MWKDDNDDIDRIYTQLRLKPKFPAQCPVCKRISAHLYMDLHDFKTRRGGLWVWCSECYTFSHSSIRVPNYWRNCPEVEVDKLCAIPEYLEEIKESIDKHINEIMRGE